MPIRLKENGGNRVIIFNVKDDLHQKELKHCIKLSLTYTKLSIYHYWGLSR